MFLAALLLPLLLVRCLRGHGGGIPAPAPPANVQFQEARTFQHVLHWEPPSTGPSPAGRLFYDVQYRWYGNSSWTPAPSCTRIASRSCDLSYETRKPSLRYVARVRAVAGNRTSGWTRTTVFVPLEATLHLSNVSLSVNGHTVHVSLELPVSPWDNATYEDSHPWHRTYHAHVRRVSNNAQFVHVATSLEFDLPALLWGERYCVSVEPHLASRPNPTNRTEEQCVVIPPLEDHARATLATPSLSLLSLTVLGTLGLGLGLAWAYVKKPTKTPDVLKSLLKCSSPWLLNEFPRVGTKGVVLCMETDTVQQLSLVGLKDHSHSSGGSHSPGAALPPPLERSCWLPTWPAEGAGPGDLVDNSGCSTDSGICLQEPSGRLSHLLGSRRLSASSEDGGLQEGVRTEEQQLRGASGAEGGLQPMYPPRTQSSGHQKRSGGPLEAVGCSRPPANMDGVAHSEPGLATGYLKQASLGVPSGLGGMAPTGDAPDKMDLKKGHLPATMSQDVSGALEFPKTLLALGFLEQEPEIPSPHICSVFHTSTQLSLDLGILTLPRCWV